jgi:ribosome-associated translation inhibitor RaiA
MKVTYGHMEVEVRKSLAPDLSHGIEKLQRLLKRYAPDLVHLHSAMERIERTAQISFSLNLSLPTGTLHAVCTAADARSSAKSAFAELITQVKKHQQKLRKDYEWKRKGGRGIPKLGDLPT